jgi:hypothetical protein
MGLKQDNMLILLISRSEVMKGLNFSRGEMTQQEIKDPKSSLNRLVSSLWHMHRRRKWSMQYTLQTCSCVAV